jgi:hypothetical protein
MHEALEQEHKGVPMRALAPEPEDLVQKIISLRPFACYMLLLITTRRVVWSLGYEVVRI